MSLSTIDQSTGNATVISGNVNDKVGNLAALTTTDKSSAVGAINEVKSGLTAVTNRVSACNITGQVVDLTQYTDANPFLIPSDGYVWVYSKTQKSTVIVVDHAYTNNLAVGSLEFDNAMYVKAGMYAYFVAAPGATNYVAAYKPLS